MLKQNIRKENIFLLKWNNEEYEKFILDFDRKFDGIIIGGIRRAECAGDIKNGLNLKSQESL